MLLVAKDLWIVYVHEDCSIWFGDFEWANHNGL